MIVSRAGTLFGTMTKLPALARIFVARHVISPTMPSTPPIVTQCPTRKGCSDLDREAGEEIAERILQRETDDDGADRRRRENLLLQDERRRQREQRDDDGVLNDVRESLGDAVHLPGVDGEGDEDVDETEGEQQRSDRADLLRHVGGPRRVREQRRGHSAGREQEGRHPQLAADVTVHARTSEHERRQQEGNSGNRRRFVLVEARMIRPFAECLSQSKTSRN